MKPWYQIDFADPALKRNTQECIEADYNNQRIIDISIMAVSFLIYFIVIVLIVKRRELQPIKMKGYRLIVVSLMGSGFILIANFL